MPKYKGNLKTIAVLPEKVENEEEAKVRRLVLLLDKCSQEGILDKTPPPGFEPDDCEYCPVKKLCSAVWAECIDYSNSRRLSYNKSKARLEEVFKQKHEFAATVQDYG